MKLKEISETLKLTSLTPELQASFPEISQGHVSDLLSDVLANAPPGSVLITIQVHMNVVAVSAHTGLAAIIFAGGLLPEDSVIQRAIEEELPLFSTRETSFETAGRLYALGLRGARS